jgi:hypothetical protein
MGNLLGSLVWGAKKGTILYHWGWVITTVVCVYYCNVVCYHSLSMDELIVNVDEGSLDVNLNLMNIASDDDDGLVSLESPDGDTVQHPQWGKYLCG